MSELVQICTATVRELDPADGTGTKYYHERLVQNLLTIPNDIIRALEGIGGPSLAEILKRSHTLLRHINELEKGGES